MMGSFGYKLKELAQGFAWFMTHMVKTGGGDGRRTRMLCLFPSWYWHRVPCAYVTLVKYFHSMNRPSLCNFKRQNYDVMRAEDEWKRRDPVSTHEWAWGFGWLFVWRRVCWMVFGCAMWIICVAYCIIEDKWSLQDVGDDTSWYCMHVFCVFLFHRRFAAPWCMMVFIVVILLGIDGSWSDVVVKMHVIVVKTSLPTPPDALD